MSIKLTQERLKQTVGYAPETGIFRAMPGRRGVKPGSILGVSQKEGGYLRLIVDGERYYAHRLAFLYMIGEWPARDVDHVNRNKSDNRWINLRMADRSENTGNGKMRKDNSTGYRGVCRHRGGYRARIKHRGRLYDLGVYQTVEQAGLTYEQANRRLLGKFTHFNERIVR